MMKKSESLCFDLPFYDMTQKIYHLSSDFCIAVVQMSMYSPRILQLHIKLIEKESKRSVCFDSMSLHEMFRQLHRLESFNIEYPCSDMSDIDLSVSLTSNPREYQLQYRNTEFILDIDTVQQLLDQRYTIFRYIQDIEHQFLRGFYNEVEDLK